MLRFLFSAGPKLTLLRLLLPFLPGDKLQTFYRISPVAVAVAAQRRARSCTATVARVAGCALTPPPQHFRVLASTLITLHSTLHLARFQLLEMSLSAQAEEQPLGSRAKQKAFAAG